MDEAEVILGPVRYKKKPELDPLPGLDQFIKIM